MFDNSRFACVSRLRVTRLSNPSTFDTKTFASLSFFFLLASRVYLHTYMYIHVLSVCREKFKSLIVLLTFVYTDLYVYSPSLYVYTVYTVILFY